MDNKENSLKIICGNDGIRYFCRGIEGEWAEVVSTESLLSKKRFKHTSFTARGGDIIDAICDEYGLDDYTVNIVFIGDDENYSALEAVARTKQDKVRITREKEEKPAAEYSEADKGAFADGEENHLASGAAIAKSSRIDAAPVKRERLIVAGYSASGKSTLIHALNRCEYKSPRVDTYCVSTYSSDFFEDAYYEVRFWDCWSDQNAVEKNVRLIEDLIGKGINTVVFCISELSNHTGNVEPITRIREKYPRLKIAIALTCSIKADKGFLNACRETLNTIKVFPLLAENYEVTDEITISAYGVEELAEYLFGGSANV